jgi:hypothetical protein
MHETQRNAMRRPRTGTQSCPHSGTWSHDHFMPRPKRKRTRGTQSIEGEERIMKRRIGMIVLAGLVACLGSCGSEDESSEDANRGAGGSRAPEKETCPEERPMNGSSCDDRGQVCEYDQGDCTCNTASMAGFGQIAWDCPFQFMAQMCPPQEPQPGAACMSVFGECPYGDSKVCDCADETDMWSCWNPADCPTTPPENMSACDPVGMECEYDDTMMDCDCTAEGWDCEMDPF